MLQQLTASGFTGRHQPRTGGGVVDEETGEEQLDPRYAPAQDALERGDIDGAVAEYQKLVDANPADAEAAAGLAMAQLLKRTDGVDLNQAVRLRLAAPTTWTPRPWWPTSTCSGDTSRTPSTGWSTWSGVRRTASATPPGPT